MECSLDVKACSCIRNTGSSAGGRIAPGRGRTAGVVAPHRVGRRCLPRGRVGVAQLGQLWRALQAGLASKGLREVAEFVLRKSGKQVTKRSVRVLTERLGKLQVRYGDDAIRAIRKMFLVE